MKKLLIVLCTFGISFLTMAQRASIQSDVKNHAKLYIKKAYAGNEKTHNLVRPNNPRVNSSNQQKAVTEIVIGGTTYDLQSNAAVQNRLFRHSDGTMSAVWTFSNSGDLAAPDRGTGYAYFNGTTWSTAPTARIEPQRNGWPSISATSAGKEVVVSHNNTASNLYVTTCPSKGTGSWAYSSINGPTANGNLWPRMVVGGANGQTVHVISVTTPTANQGVAYQGLDGALTYSRSTDGGNTWDINQVILPQLTASEGFYGFSGDQYSIDVKGDTVAFVFGGFEESVVLMKSTDNGTTWTRTVVYGHPMGLAWNSTNSISDVDGDAVADTLNVCDGSVTVLLDNNGIAHVAFGIMRILKDDPNAQGVSFFPATSGLAYWNETMIDSTSNEPLCPNIIIDVEDRDASGIVFDDLQNIDQIATYYISLTSQPSMGIDNNGTLYLAYSALLEGTNNGNGQYYRNIHIMKSTDNGANWSIPLNVTNDDFSEGVFASVAKNVGTEVHLIYQRDTEPGLAVRGDQDPFGQNEIVYARIPVVDIPSTPNGLNIPYCGDNINTGIKKLTSKINSLQVYPNPTNGMLNITYISEVEGEVNVRLVNLNGQEVMNQTFNKANGEFFNTINMNNFAKGVYMLQVFTPERTITEKVVSY